MRNNSKSNKKEFYLPRTSAADLMGKQSVRTTFKLSAECIDAISILSAQMGIKQKSLFDHLMEDADSLAAIAQHAGSEKLHTAVRIQKTFVVSRKSLSLLDAICRKFGSSRDDLVEYSVQRLLPVLVKERQKQGVREALSLKIAAHLNEAESMLGEIKRLLGTDDPVYQTMNAVLDAYKKASRKIETFIEKGRRIAEFPMEKFS